MNVNWEEILMDAITIAVITLIGTVVFQIIADLKGYKKIAAKMGNHKSDTLEGQHERIIEKTNGVEKIIAEKTNGIAEGQRNIFSKVDSIDKEMSANKERTASLTLDQRDIRDNVNKLINDWEHAIAENKELKARNAELEKKYMELDKQYNELEIKNKELEKQNEDMSVRHRRARGMDKGMDR